MANHPPRETELAVVDVSPLLHDRGDTSGVAERIRHACCDCGFFYIVGHGVRPELGARLERLSRAFFSLPLERKLEIRMELGGRAWRGYFPVGEELTTGRPDQKEGIYFGAELSEEDERVRAGVPLHGANLFPREPTGFREPVLEYLDAMTALGHTVMEGVALSLGLERSYFAERCTKDPLILFRIFNYPAIADPDLWSVGEHTDYGLLTILRQDDRGGLQVKSRDGGWIEAPPIPGSFVCNIGDMLDRMTGGFYRSTPHRVRNASGRERLSFPFFFDPNFGAEVEPIDPHATIVDDRDERWDKASVHDFSGTYGEYLLSKVSRVFPQLRSRVL